MRKEGNPYQPKRDFFSPVILHLPRLFIPFYSRPLFLFPCIVSWKHHRSSRWNGAYLRRFHTQLLFYICSFYRISIFFSFSYDNALLLQSENRKYELSVIEENLLMMITRWSRRKEKKIREIRDYAFLLEVVCEEGGKDPKWQRVARTKSGSCSVARLRRSCAHLNNAHNKVCNGEGGGWAGFR